MSRYRFRKGNALNQEAIIAGLIVLYGTPRYREDFMHHTTYSWFVEGNYKVTIKAYSAGETSVHVHPHLWRTRKILERWRTNT